MIFYVVRDPGPESTPEDCFAEVDAIGLARLVLGTGLERWQAECTEVFGDRDDATRDLARRLRPACPPAEDVQRHPLRGLPMKAPPLLPGVVQGADRRQVPAVGGEAEQSS